MIKLLQQFPWCCVKAHGSSSSEYNSLNILANNEILLSIHSHNLAVASEQPIERVSRHSSVSENKLSCRWGSIDLKNIGSYKQNI